MELRASTCDLGGDINMNLGCGSSAYGFGGSITGVQMFWTRVEVRVAQYSEYT